jgi:hypothetical protein
MVRDCVLDTASVVLVITAILGMSSEHMARGNPIGTKTRRNLAMFYGGNHVRVMAVLVFLTLEYQDKNLRKQ